ncbi:Chaperone protein dnaJ 11 [Melia azedarach]|uniref:Chaperone protein dnaJ 11 n=1 Tax=Melia azedarach TaxID=155640 RepID=A0ACC1XRY8_MELAZ|nr:Chaperone protein dnaJ 11 [Melia azedarach]
MASCASLYEVLGIPTGATSQEIKTAYRRLARTCHPDVVGTNRKDSSPDEFIKIHAAYCTLSDPEKRAVYDQNLFRRRRPLTAMSGYSGYSGRNWETDQCW